MSQVDTISLVAEGATTDTTVNTPVEAPVDGATDTTVDTPNETELTRGISPTDVVTDDTGEPGTWGHYSAWCQQ